MNYFRTAILLAGLTALFMGVGYLIGGQTGVMIALVVAAGMNLFSLLELRQDGAVDARRAGGRRAHRARPLSRMVQRARAAAPACRCRASTSWTIRSRTRSRPAAIRENAAVAVTTGLLQHADRARRSPA